MSAARVCTAGLAAALLAGCGAIGGFVGAAASIATSFATANPALGLAVGVAAQSATDETLRYVARRRQHAEHDAIVAAVADMEPGQIRKWQHAHLVGSGTEGGEVRVLRLIETPLATCKELLFSVTKSADKPAAWFTTTACRHGEVWKWAAAEPAVERWGNLQ
ncbi:MAG: hypothetical protein JWO70_139 [Betaproteobacteria bacterium]|nr:hypothetical protein [Betaproteobacteria bacterium]